MKQTVKKSLLPKVVLCSIIAALSAFVWQSSAADEKDDPIKKVMNTYHKAPRGTDPVSKKASDGKATPEELKQLTIAYKELMKTKPPRGDEKSWQEKTGKLLAAAEALHKGQSDGLPKFKEAVNCKACHSVHKPE